MYRNLYLAAFAAVLALPAIAPAAPLVTGSTIPLFGTTAVTDPSLAALVVASVARPIMLLDSFGNTLFNGNFADFVARENGSGTLTFYLRIDVLSGSATIT